MGTRISHSLMDRDDIWMVKSGFYGYGLRKKCKYKF
jgi:hypothetical protein